MNIGVLALVMMVFGYLLLIMPRLTKKEETKVLLNRYYAHRGYHNNEGGIPENSLFAFRRAVENEYGIELDVQLTKDNQLVVFHDSKLKRVCNVKGNIGDYTYQELQNFYLLNTEEQIPLFSDVLKVVSGKVPLIIEIKMKGSSTAVCEVLNCELEHYQGIYCIESFNPLAVVWYRIHRPEIIRGQLSSGFMKEKKKFNIALFAVEHLLTNILTRPDFIAYNHLYKGEWSRSLCRSMFKSLSVTWTIKSREELEQAKQYFDIFIFEGFAPKM